MDRNGATVAYAILLLLLAATSFPRLTGDAIEYVTMAGRLAHFRGPAIEATEARPLGLQTPTLVNRAGRQELWHFWLFPLIAAPLVGSSTALGFSPIVGFTVLNVVMLAWAFRRTLVRFGPWAAALVFVSPLIWWVDKAQVEIFTVALLALALTCSDRLSLAALCCAIAAAQNPPLAIGAVYAAARAVQQEPRVRGPQWAWWLSAAIVVLHPLYYFLNLGRPTPLVSGDILLPAPSLLLLPIADLSAGLVWMAPLFIAAVIASGAVAWRTARRAILFAAAGTLFLLFSFAQTANLNSGGTPSLDRYALWLFPLALPFVAEATRSTIVKGLIAFSVAWSVIAFHPAVAESYLRPSALALAVWTQHPDWNNPPAEMFAERIRHADGAHTLAATQGCEKILMTEGQWPTGCESAVRIPDRCLTGICYVNRQSDDSVRFVETARRPGYRLR